MTALLMRFNCKFDEFVKQDKFDKFITVYFCDTISIYYTVGWYCYTDIKRGK